jgi:hypothetical protein
MERQRPFNRQAFVALMAAISGIGLPFSGFAHHLLHNDPIAFYRNACMAVHWSMGVMFVVFAVWHTILHRRMLLTYAKWSADMLALSRELVLASALGSILIFLSAVYAFIAD